MSTDSAEDFSPRPQPTAHEVEPGCSLDRRTFLQGTAAAAAIAAGGAASTGTASASTASTIVDGLKEAVTGAATAGAIGGPQSLAVWVGAVALGEIYGGVSESPSADRHSLHQLVHNEIEWMNAHLVNFGNYMEDTRPIASLEARHGMATAWEDGDGSADAYDTALQMIRQYYELPEFNHAHTGNKALLQLSYIQGSGYDTDPQYNVQTTGEDDGGDPFIFRISDEREDVDLELHAGTQVDENAFDEIDHIEPDDGTMTTPIVDIIDDTGDDEETVDSFPIVTNDVIDAYDPDGEEFEIELDGTTYTTDLEFMVQNVGDYEDDPALGQQIAFEGPAFFELFHDIEEMSDDVVSNYDQSFIEDIYDELDAGNITPEQVRSPEGMARYLSGTDDVESERFQIAWMQQFGFERADMSLVRGMEVSWTGATDMQTDTDPDRDRRRTYPAEYVENETYDGVLFGSDLPDDGFQSGNEYAVGPQVFVPDADDDRIIAHTLGSDEENWSYEYTDPLNGGVAVSPDRSTVYVGHQDDGVVALDATDGTEIWDSENLGNRPRQTSVVPDGPVIASTTSETHGIDTDDGSQLWEYTEGSSSHSIPPDGDTVFTHDGPEVHSVDPSNGSQNWTHTLSGDALVSEAGVNGDLFALTDTDPIRLVAIDSEGSEKWSVDTDIPTDSHPRGIIEKTDGTLLVTEGGNGDIYAYDSSDGSEKWSEDVLPDFGGFMKGPRAPTSDKIIVYEHQETEFVVFDYTDRSTKTYQHPPTLNGARYVQMWHPSEQVDGMAAAAIINDENAEGQVNLTDGVLEIHDMYDAGGATIEHVNDETINDLETATGEDIDTIIDDMDEFDDESDIRYTRDVIDILEHYDAGDELENVHTEETDYSSPDYDTFDSTDFAEAMTSLEEKIEQIEEEDDDTNVSVGIDNPLDDFGDGAVWVGLAVIVMVVLTVVSIVTDAIPILNN